MTHAHHETLPGYSPAQILHDGCPECERRSEDVALVIGYLDATSFAAAWTRAEQRRRFGLLDQARAEFWLLEVLSAVQVQLGRADD